MAGFDLTHPLFEAMRSEHRKIIEALSSLQIGDDLHKKLNELYEFAELSHHKKEESLLFNVLEKNSLLKEGGPFCMFFFDAHLNDRPLTHCQELTKESPVIEAHQQIFYDNASPLRIPIDEHRSGKALLSHLLTSLPQMSETEINRHLELYKKIQTSNIQKEETCLFHVILRLLSSRQADEIYSLWNPPLVL